MKIALEMEREGYQIYISAAKKTLNKLGKLTLEAIAAKELDHIKAIENFNQGLSKAITLINPKSKEDYVHPIMDKLKDELGAKAEADPDLEKAYQAAMGLEKKSYDLYKKLGGEADDPQAVKFFEFLMGEENTHHELLSETLQYLTRTGDWYREQERWIVEG